MENTTYKKLDNKSLKVMFISYSIYIFIIYTFLFIISIIFEHKISDIIYKYVIIVLLLSFILTELLTIFCITLHYRKYMFKITEYGITIKSGIFGDIKEFIPYNTIKSIEINNGPIMRKYNFSNIELNKINYSSTLKYINSDIVNDIKNKIVYNKDKYMNNMI